jgi:hypothetical protein
MLKTEILRFRAEPQHVEKMRRLKEQTGVSWSELFRRLVEGVDIQPIDTKVILSVNEKNDDTTLQGNRVVVRS